MTSSLKHRVAGFLTVFLILFCASGNAQIVHGIDARDTKMQVGALEKSCVLNLRTLNVAQITYQGGDVSKGFARTLKQLGPDGEGLLDAAQVSGEKDGYWFQLVPDKNAATQKPVQHYKIIARPVKRLIKSQRSYYTDESGVIRFTEKLRKAAVTDPPLEPPYDR